MKRRSLSWLIANAVFGILLSAVSKFLSACAKLPFKVSKYPAATFHKYGLEVFFDLAIAITTLIAS